MENASSLKIFLMIIGRPEFFVTCDHLAIMNSGDKVKNRSVLAGGWFSR